MLNAQDMPKTQGPAEYSANGAINQNALIELVVSPDGRLENPGTLAAPTTLEGAREMARKIIRSRPGVIRVLLRGGRYFRSESFELGLMDSGTAINPIEFAAFPNETPHLVGGCALEPQLLHLVSKSDPNWARLTPETRNKIYVADLSTFQTDLGNLISRADTAGQVNQSMEVFTDGTPLTLARYPKAANPESVNLSPKATLRVSGDTSPDITGDYMYKGRDDLGRPYYQLAKGGDLWSIAASKSSPDWTLSNRHDLGGRGTPAAWGVWDSFAGPVGSFRPASGAKGTAFLERVDGLNPMPGFLLIHSSNSDTTIQAPVTRMKRWLAKEAMYFGFGFYGWSASHSALSSIDPLTASFQLATKPLYGLRTGQPFFFYNLLEELTDPGEYFIDRSHARLYVRPLKDTIPNEVFLSRLQSPLVSMWGTNWITFRGIVFEAARDTLVDVQECKNVAFRSCLFQNAGGWGLFLSGFHNQVEACELKQLGKGGIRVCGGNRATLLPSQNLIENCNIHHFGRIFWTNQPAIHIVSLTKTENNDDCVGVLILHNEIHHAPHIAVNFKGNDHIIKFNHIHHVCQWANDAGAIYSSRDWGSQGNVIQFNLIHNNGGPFGNWISGIYLDGCSSGITVAGNILYKAGPNFAIQLNGGRDLKIRYNILVGHWYGIDVSNVGVTTITNNHSDTWNLLEKIRRFSYKSPPWSIAYPNLAAIPDRWEEIQGSHWLQPEGSELYGNLHAGLSGDLFRQNNYSPQKATVISWFSKVAENLTQVDPQFVDPGRLDFQLRPSSPAFRIPGFPGIDSSGIGIVKVHP
jgi:hypothetical protein